MDRGLVGLAFAAGLVAALNPCGFAMLPAYLLLVVRGRRPGERTRLAALGRAGTATAMMALGFVTVFGSFGALTIAAAATVQRYVPYATVVIGVALVALGIWLLSGRELTPRPVGPRWAPTVRLGSMYGYGVSYAIASLSCTIGPFLAVTAAGFRGGSVVTGVAVYLAYVAGLTLVVGVLAVAAADLARAGSTLPDRLRRVLPFVNRVGGALLMLVGLYVGYYGVYELRLSSAAANPHDAVIAAAGRLQGALAGWVHQHGVWPWAVALFVLVAGSWYRRMGRTRRAKRRLPEPTAAAAPHVADQHEEGQHGEPDQEHVLDVTDVVAAQHRQQKDHDDQPGGAPGAVVDPAPPPGGRRHLGDVDAVEVLHLGTGHGESLS